MNTQRQCAFAVVLMTAVAGLTFGEEPKSGPEQTVTPPQTKIDSASQTAPATKPSSDLSGFNKRAPADRLDIAMAILVWREAKLQNFSYEAEFSEPKLTDDFKLEPIKHTRTTWFDRAGEIYRERLQHFERDGTVRLDSSASWDGKQSKSLSPRILPNGNTELRGVVLATEPDGVRFNLLNQMLGFRTMTTVQTFESLMERFD